MKKLWVLMLMSLTVCLSACAAADDTNTDKVPGADHTNVTMDGAERIISTLDYENSGKMGDTDGPAFVVYSNIGYSGASATLDIANMEINTVLGDGKFVNAYTFFGIDVYNGGWWVNCVDAGFCWSGENGGWHLCYNLYEPLNEDTYPWYESSKILPQNDVYTLTLKLIDDNYAELTAVGRNTGETDSVVLEVKGALKDGSNTAFLFNTALDYPPDTKVDREGNPSEDWAEITLANTDKGIYLRSYHASGLKLYQGEEEFDWTDDKSSAISIWPDKKIDGFDYAPTEVGLFDGTEYYINLDMNR